MSKQLKNYTYGDIAFTQTVLIDNVPYVTRQAIGEWLDYTDPQKAIDKILERNSDIESRSVPVKLTATDGKNYETRVYDPVGFLLIVLASGQPKAKEKFAEIVEFICQFPAPGEERLSPKERRLIQARISTLSMHMAKTEDAMVTTQLWLELRGLCDKIGADYPDLALLGKDNRQLSLPGFDAPKLD